MVFLPARMCVGRCSQAVCQLHMPRCLQMDNAENMPPHDRGPEMLLRDATAYA